MRWPRRFAPRHDMQELAMEFQVSINAMNKILLQEAFPNSQQLTMSEVIFKSSDFLPSEAHNQSPACLTLLILLI